jgi:hypothetical protein
MEAAVLVATFWTLTLIILGVIHVWDHEDNADAPMSRDE